MTDFHPDDKISVIRTHGGQAPEFISISELNTLIDANDHVVQVDLSSVTGYNIQPSDTVVIATATAETGSKVNLPEATGSYRRITVKNLSANAMDTYPTAGGTIDGAEDPVSIAALGVVTVFDCAATKWIII